MKIISLFLYFYLLIGFNSIKIKSGAHMKSQMEMYFLNLGKNFKMKIRTMKILKMMIKINLMQRWLKNNKLTINKMMNKFKKTLMMKVF